MLNRLIEWSLAHRGLVLGISAIVLVLGIFTALRLPVEVLPDLTKPTVVILTEAPGLAPEEVETRVTQPIETALMGVAGLTRPDRSLPSRARSMPAQAVNAASG